MTGHPAGSKSAAELGLPPATWLATRAERCARDSDWCDGTLCRERGIDCPNADPPSALSSDYPLTVRRETT